MKKMSVYLIIFLLVPLVGKPIVTGDNTAAETDPVGSQGFIWDYVYNYKNSSSVAVDPYWLLTAAHVADDGGTGALTIGSTTYNQQEILYHDTADLALVRYDKAFPGYYSLFTGTLVPRNPKNVLTAIMVGYGNTGTVSATSWTDSGSGRGTRRWGTQKIDRTETVLYNAGGGSKTNSGFWMDFDLGNTSYEAGAGVYDSGGGTFVDDNGIWRLAGINTLRLGSGGLYTSSFSIATQDYEPWITETVPEPTTGIFIAVVFGAFGIIKRARYTMR